MRDTLHAASVQVISHHVLWASLQVNQVRVRAMIAQPARSLLPFAHKPAQSAQQGASTKMK
eukprot:6293944-Amphidinium_carterae.1